MPILPLLALACGSNPPPPAPGVGPTLRVLTYNVNFEQMDPRTVQAVAAAGADLVFLQETHTAWAEALEAPLAPHYPHRAFHEHPPDGGSAVLSRWPIHALEHRPSPVGAFPATCLVAETPLGALRVLHLHLHPPLDENGLFTGYFTTRGKRAAELAAHLTCFDGPPDLVVGDLNEEAGQAVNQLLANGLIDAAAHRPERTWRWPTAWGELDGRPDHLFHSPALTTAHVGVRHEGGSDHWPLIAELQRRAP